MTPILYAILGAIAGVAIMWYVCNLKLRKAADELKECGVVLDEANAAVLQSISIIKAQKRLIDDLRREVGK